MHPTLPAPAVLETCRKHSITAAYYAYIIAFLAKHTEGLYDCDIGSPNLCEKGASFIRRNKAEILRTYSSFSNETARRLGRDAQVSHPPAGCAASAQHLRHLVGCMFDVRCSRVHAISRSPDP